MDSYVFCLAKKKALLRLHKEMNDLVGSPTSSAPGGSLRQWHPGSLNLQQLVVIRFSPGYIMCVLIDNGVYFYR